jgi:hypothetical protein
MAVAIDTLTPAQVAPATTILDASLISFGRELCGDLPSALRREWLVTKSLRSSRWQRWMYTHSARFW